MGSLSEPMAAWGNSSAFMEHNLGICGQISSRETSSSFGIPKASANCAYCPRATNLLPLTDGSYTEPMPQAPFEGSLANSRDRPGTGQPRVTSISAVASARHFSRSPVPRTQYSSVGTANGVVIG